MTITPIQALVTKTAAFNGASIDVSSFTGDWIIRLRITKFSPVAGTARFTFNDSVNAFTNELPGPSRHIAGGLTNDPLAGGPQQPNSFAFYKRDFPDLRIGTASALIRCALQAINGTTPSITYEAWLETM